MPWHDRPGCAAAVGWRLAGFCWLISAATASAEFDARLKWFTSGTLLPGHDVQRVVTGTPTYDYSADLRLLWRQDLGAGFRLVVDHTTLVNGGDSFAAAALNNSATLDQTPMDDDARVADLTWEIEDGDRHRSLHRFDRLALQYRGGNWAVTVGRQAVSWGSGLVFQPLDLFSPFAPTTVDRDYKAGDDLLLVERVFDGGSDVQFLAVGRRNRDGDITSNAGSFAIKGRTFLGAQELEAVVGRHYRDDVLGLTVKFPIGGALVRTDVLVTRLDDGEDFYSGIVNMDYSFMLAQRNAYVFVEYFHNDFGVSRLPDNPLQLPLPLVDRLSRGELFNLMRNYAAVGLNYEWHPLVTQTLTVITNLHDSSSIVQTQVNYEPGDHQRLEAGWVQPTGRAGDEFGGVPVGFGFTTGGGARGYVRWVYYF